MSMKCRKLVTVGLTMAVFASTLVINPAVANAAESDSVTAGSESVLCGIPAYDEELRGEAVTGTTVDVIDPTVPKVSADKILEDQKALDAENEKEEKRIAEQKKAAKKKYKKALRLLAAIVYCEAGGQCYAGRLAVAAVVMNRVESAGYPNTIHGVLWQPYQFGPIRQGKMARELRYYDQGLYNQPERIGSLQAAKDILAGKYTVEYNGRTIDLKQYHNFNGHLSNAKIRISGHDFA